jgi:hypothetical protein
VNWRSRPFFLGFLGALTALLVGILLGVSVLVYVRASHGEQAYQYLIEAIKQQQAQKK